LEAKMAKWSIMEREKLKEKKKFRENRRSGCV
jgi:hypothetical protein